jgi:hypothetical protein
VTLDVERIEERTVPVALHYVGNLRGSVVVSDAKVEPTTATLRAPTSDLANVASVRVDVALPGEPATFDAMLRPIATDEHGAEIAAVSVAPNLVRVRAAFVSAKRTL